jgi:ribosome biogenesis GTPase A
MPTKPSGRFNSQNRTAFQHFQEQLKYVDLVIELCDGRAPFSSRHPRSKEIFGTKPRLLILTKEDLADNSKVKGWLDFFNAEGRQAKALSVSLKEQKQKSKIFQLILDLTKEKREQIAGKGLLPRAMRVTVVGMPNVGKSSLINWLIGQKRARVGNKPGITKGAQWVRVHPEIELLDTPGIMPAFSFSGEASWKLCLLNLLPENVYDVEEVAENGLQLMKQQYPSALQSYLSEPAESITLEEIARKRNFLAVGGVFDRIRAANVFVSDLRNSKLGRLTLDSVNAMPAKPTAERQRINE